MSEAPRTGRRWLRFSLRTTLAIVTLLCVVPGTWVSRSVRQHDAIAALTKDNDDAVVEYSYEVNANYDRTDGQPPGPQWLRDLLGIDFFATVTAVRLRNASDSRLLLLKDLRGLRSLDLANSRSVTDAGLLELNKSPGLRNLLLYDVGVTDGGLAALESLTHLENLCIISCEQITDAGMPQLSKIASLRKLNVTCPQVTNAGMAELRRLKNLNWLVLDFSGPTTAAVLEPLQSLASLRHLELVYGTGEPDEGARAEEGRAGLKYLSGFRQLETLDIYGNDSLDETTFSQLPRLPGVKSLSLVLCLRLTDDSMRQLEKFPNLENLFLSDPAKMGDGAIEHLQRLPKLKNLSISDNAIRLTDAGMASIAQLPALRSLRLTGCNQFTDTGLLSLAALSQLDELEIAVDQLTQLSATALANLARALPKCRIDYRQRVRAL